MQKHTQVGGTFTKPLAALLKKARTSEAKSVISIIRANHFTLNGKPFLMETLISRRKSCVYFTSVNSRTVELTSRGKRFAVWVFSAIGTECEIF